MAYLTNDLTYLILVTPSLALSSAAPMAIYTLTNYFTLYNSLLTTSHSLHGVAALSHSHTLTDSLTQTLTDGVSE